MKVITFDPKKKKQVLCGEFEDGVLYRDVNIKHFMKVLNGYGIQEDAFELLAEMKCKRIVLIEEVTGTKWSADMDVWLEHSKIADYGHGKQRFLSLKYMKQER